MQEQEKKISVNELSGAKWEDVLERARKAMAELIDLTSSKIEMARAAPQAHAQHTSPIRDALERWVVSARVWFNILFVVGLVVMLFTFSLVEATFLQRVAGVLPLVLLLAIGIWLIKGKIEKFSLEKFYLALGLRPGTPNASFIFELLNRELNVLEYTKVGEAKIFDKKTLQYIAAYVVSTLIFPPLGYVVFVVGFWMLFRKKAARTIVVGY